MSESAEPVEPSEAAEARELSERLKEAHEGREKPPISVSVGITVLAILSAVLAVFAHRSQTEKSLLETRRNDEWSLYQQKQADRRQIQTSLDLFAVLAPQHSDMAKRKSEEYGARRAAIEEQLQAISGTARDLEEKSGVEEQRGSRISFGQILIQIGILLGSVTLYVNRRAYFILGAVFGAAGFLIALASIFF